MERIDDILEKLVKKIKNNISEMGNEVMDYPDSKDGMYFGKDKKGLPMSHIFSWTQSFHSGNAYWAYKLTGDEDILKWLYSLYDLYYDKVNKTPIETMHDLGFIFSPYAVAMYKLTGDPNMKQLALTAADVLAKRYIPKANIIQAWGRMDGKIPEYVDAELAKDIFFTDGKGRVIVDCMMNLPLLFWASEVSGHPYYKSIAVCFADKVLEDFIRDDNSVVHSIVYDTETGEMLRESNVCGYSNGSHWARGTTWATYGFAIAYSYTGDERYLDAAVKLSEKFVEECNGEIPLRDFKVPEGVEQSIDTSAAALMLCTIAEISKYRRNSKLEEYADIIEEKILDYVDLNPEVNGILKEQDGYHLYTSFGDYYFMEYFVMKKTDAERIW